MLIDFISDTDLSVLKSKLQTVSSASSRLEKVASLEVPDKNSLSEHAFAWPEERLFPMYTPDLAMLSSVYLEQNESVPEFVKTACEEACELFGQKIQIGSLEKIAKEKETLSADDFVFPKRQKLPLVDKDSIRMSTGIFLKTASSLNAEDLIVGARQIIKHASANDEPIPSEIERYALYGTIGVHEADEFLKERYLETEDDGYVKIAKELEGDRVRSLKKVASLVFDISKLDATNSIEKTASTVINDLIEDGASGEVFSLGNMEIEADKIASIDSEEWRELYPDSIVEELFSDGGINMSMLSELSDGVATEEKEAIASFIETHI